jgi:hypothetical protein
MRPGGFFPEEMIVAKTYQDVVTEARVLLQDTDSASYRYENSTLLAIYNRALQVLCRTRPDAAYDLFSGNALNVPELVESGAGAGQTDWTDTFGLEMQFFTPLVHYVVGLAELTDDEYTEDGRAVALLTIFKQSLLGV